MRTLLISISALLLTKSFLTAAHPIPQTVTPIQVLESLTHDVSFVGEINGLQHQEAATVQDNNNELEARTGPPVWQAPPIEIPPVFVPSSHAGKPLFLNVPYPDNKLGVASIFALMKYMEPAMGDLTIRKTVSDFETTLMKKPYQLTTLRSVGQDLMNPLSSSAFKQLQTCIVDGVGLHNEGHWLEDSIPTDKGEHWMIDPVLDAQGWHGHMSHPQHHTPTRPHDQLPGADVPTAPGPRTSSQQINGHHVPPGQYLDSLILHYGSIHLPPDPQMAQILYDPPGPTFPSPPRVRPVIIWVPPDFLPDHTKPVPMIVPSSTNTRGCDSMVAFLNLLGSASRGRQRQNQQLSYILSALRNNYGFPQLSLDTARFQIIADTELSAFKVRIMESLDRHNRDFSIPDPEENNPPQPAAGPQPLSNSEAAKLAMSRMRG
ncbi:hypothetical protein H0H93_009295 [Arthromyces matolae]|nr:hypothetical protein H0H93_009295 [Arthromyces matolae]